MTPRWRAPPSRPGRRWLRAARDAADVRARAGTDSTPRARPALEGDGAPGARGRGDEFVKRGRAGGGDSGVGLNARLVLATDEATAADSISDGRRENERAALAAAAAATAATPRRMRSPRGKPSVGVPRVSPSGVLVRDTRPELARPLRRRAPRGHLRPRRLARLGARGMNAVVADARGDTRRLERLERSPRRARERPRRSRRASSAAPPDAWAAEWMSGPDPRDTAEGEGEGDTPAAAPAPTLESVAEEVARALRLPSAGTTPGTSDARNPKHANSRDALVVPGGVAARASGRARVGRRDGFRARRRACV